jgi:hypothetical protein
MIDRGTQNNISTTNKSYVLPQRFLLKNVPTIIKQLWENRRGNQFFFLLNGDTPSYGVYISRIICSTTKRPNYSQATLRKPKGQSFFSFYWMVTPHHMAFTFLVSYVLSQNALTTLKQLWKNRRSNKTTFYWMVTPHYMVFTFLVSYGLPQSDPPTIKYLWENRRGNQYFFLLDGDAPSYGTYISLLVFMHTYVIVFLILITVIL